ncbi:MAG: bifunctional (p)ppGpp synthetase/guanosine-3',5'-bis(diphosphate) 3'-pyrophosphohydrolase [Dehalococcoidia bacterium]|nr:bifunctional (p)ppGpp synthetase/guanosine-3',5'-bis(diphosphate) 3'-pyrophosphohydrolase [Dehalococcoidia bacterium]
MMVDALLEKAGRYLPLEKLAMVSAAYDYAFAAHEGQKRLSGEPFMAHPFQVALTLVDQQMDATTLAAALLHDVVEDTGISLVQIEEKFGPDVTRLVEGVSKISRLALPMLGEHLQRASVREAQAENLRKMLVAMADDLRVVFIKLADRLHNMHTIFALSEDRQKAIARETLEIYSPLAHRLGIWDLKWQLEDLAFHILDPHKYTRIAHLVTNRRAEREEIITEVITTLKREFGKINLDCDISGRPKHLYSIAQKIERYVAQGRQFDEIYDLLAVRVLVDTVSECYHAIGVVHNLWHPIPGSFDDYIANPKPNGYQSLHTAVLFRGTTPLEIQVRTRDMHRIAEYGVAAHWRYKDGDGKGSSAEERIGWLRQLIEWHREMAGSEEFLESVKTDIFNDQVFVFTPKGEIRDLPKGSTPIDFAYRIHTDLGNRVAGAKVNGRMVSLDYQLGNGNVVEILTSKKSRGPSRDWLSPNLGFVKSSHARDKIRQWFKKQERHENVELGRGMLDKELKHLGLDVGDRERIAKLFKYDNMDDFFAAVGCGDVSPQTIAFKLSGQEQEPSKPVLGTPFKPTSTAGIQVMGTGNLLTNLARCCNPVPGDLIIGYVTRNRGITIHRHDCYNVTHEDEKDRLVHVEWGRPAERYPVKMQVEAWDRVGLVRDISTLLAEEKVNISNMNVNERKDRTTSLFFDVETTGLPQLSRIMSRIETVLGVTNVTRVGEEHSSSQHHPKA